MAETADDEEVEEQPEEPRTAAQVRSEYRAAVEAELAEAEAMTDAELSWELGRREMAALEGLDDPEERAAAVQAARVEWVTERRLEAELEAKLAARLAKKQAEQADKTFKRARQRYGPGPIVGGGGVPPSPSVREPSPREKLYAGQRLTPEEARALTAGESKDYMRERTGELANQVRANYWTKVGP